MKITTKHPTDTKVVLTITLGTEELAAAEKVALAKIAHDIKVPGFRKGRVPQHIAAKNVDPSNLHEKTLDNAVSKAVAKAFIDEKLQALDRPSVEIKKFVPGELVEFTAEVEILPKITLGNYKKLKAKVEKQAVSTQDVEDIIERMRHGLAEKTEVKREAKSGDETVIDFVGKKAGIAFDGGTGTDYALALGSNSFIPGFEEGIVGHKPGETFDLELKFPDDYHAVDLKGQKVTFTVTLKSVKESSPPEIDDAFAAKTGPFKTVAEMKADIKRELTAKKEREAKEKLKDALVGELIEISKIPVPEILIEDQVKSIQQDFAQNLSYQGATLETYLRTQKFKDEEAWIEKEVKPTAIKRVKAGLALAELSKVEGIKASDDEIKTHIELYKTQYANSPEALKQFEQPEVQRDIANRLLTEKTVDRLVELNTK